MERYLVYDSSCSVCSRLAETVQEATAGKLSAISIRGEQAKALLDRAYPGGWQHAPYLIMVRDRRVLGWTGIPAALRLGLLMGPRKALRVWRTAQQAGAAVPGGEVYNASRRQFLKISTAAVAAAGLGAAGLRPGASLLAQTSCSCCTSGCGATCGCYLQSTGAYCETGCNPSGCQSGYGTPSCYSFTSNNCDGFTEDCFIGCTNSYCGPCDGHYIGSC